MTADLLERADSIQAVLEEIAELRTQGPLGHHAAWHAALVWLAENGDVVSREIAADALGMEVRGE